MKKCINIIVLALIVGINGCRPSAEPPVAKVIPHTFNEWGNTRIDNYHWIRLSDEQKTAETPDAQTRDVLDYIGAENAWLDSGMVHTAALQDELFNEMKERIPPYDASVPYVSNGYLYWHEYEEGKEYPIYYRRLVTETRQLSHFFETEEERDKFRLETERPAELLFDVNRLAEGKSYCQAGRPVISPDNRYMAYAVDYVGRRKYTIHFVDLSTGIQLDEHIDDTGGSVVWANDSRTVFYLGKVPVELRNGRVYRHVLGTATSADVLYYEEKDATFNLQLGKTKSNKYITITAHQTLSSETFILNANVPERPFAVFVPRSRNHLYSIDHIGNTFYIRSNRDALNFKLMKTADHITDESNWTEVIPHRDDVLLNSFVLFNDWLAVSEQKNGLPHIRIIGLKGGEQSIPFSEEVYTASFVNNEAPELYELHYNYSSLTTPSTVYAYNMRTGETKLLKSTAVFGEFDRRDYETRRLWATAGDGAKIPISIVYRKGFPQDGRGKLLLYAYGSYGVSSVPSFNSSVISLLDRGFAYAIAHIRGGSELGRQWYENGKLLKKKNTFTDFNDCARYLIAEKYASPSTLYATGRSAGGLLMGAVVNMEPELYKAVVAGVPFVDVVSTMLDETIPLTTFEWDEWGNPAQKEYYDYMLSYSPYDQVKAQRYPHMLVTTSFWDSQVQYWEPVKWVAKLRALKTDNNKLYLYCNMNAGHGGASGRFEQLKTRAMEYAFILSVK
ncbi:MAG: S9 family peptidase [Tannerella sp.]|jgi:oligopeptidase B|nr:S9 family peptidase [Tannerella sp.]